ncbi:MAG TPA: AzlC family ABC transporter permease [Euzebya sp.]|nr:AzlC family ABC transporter permease [Euzebya sp.]
MRRIPATDAVVTSAMVDAVPVATAIGVFGVIYGATATTVISPPMVAASSVLLFSGAAQFAMVGLIAAGATPVGILLGVTVLGLRHIPLAAVVLPRLAVSRPRRALLALVLLDETAGLAVASQRPASRTLALVGSASYLAWVVGTLAGILGADLLAAAPLASVVFIILYIGLAALTSRSRADVRRAVAAGVGATGVLIAVPSAGAPGAILVALGCAVARGRRP